MKTVRGDVLITYHILYHYSKKIKKSPKIQKWSDRQRSESQADDIILDACMKFENRPIKTVGEETFYSYFILSHYFKISPKIQKQSDRQKKKTQARLVISYLMPV